MNVEQTGNLRNNPYNIVLNSDDIGTILKGKIAKRDIDGAINLMCDNDIEVDKALKEYDPKQHAVMRRRDKDRKGKNPYVSEKLPRTRQRYINEIALFFLLGKPIIWRRKRGDEEAYNLFVDFLDDNDFDDLMREAKRLAGSETESTVVFELTGEEGKIEVTPFVAARSKGFRTRTLFDKYGHLVALAYGYGTKADSLTKWHWDILTAEKTYYTYRDEKGWHKNEYDNPTGKINALYFSQRKEWDGAEPRMHREEMADSKVADSNNYFSDPMAEATADVIENLKEPDVPGRLIQLSGTNSRFGYIQPPADSPTRIAEKKDLNDSMLFDTFTPDFSYDNIRGLGSLSGEALRNALKIGYIKRDNNIEIYGKMVKRFKNVVIAILKQLHPDKAKELDELRIEFSFADPFSDAKDSLWAGIVQLRGAGLVSLETAVRMLNLTGDDESEIERLRMEEAERMQAQQEQAEGLQAAKNPEGPNPEEIKKQKQAQEEEENENAES